MLRFSERTQKIAHIPKILYHWRMHKNSTSTSSDTKPYAYISSKKAVEEALIRRDEIGEAVGDQHGMYNIRYVIKEYKKVSIIIPTRDFGDTLDKCLTSIFTKTIYPNYEVLVIDNHSVEENTHKVFTKWKTKEKTRFKVLKSQHKKFNYSRINNQGVQNCDGYYLLFLNNDTEVINQDWLNAMVEQAQRPSVGAVGALLFYPDNTIQHAGVTVGLGGVAAHRFPGFPSDYPGYFRNVQYQNNVSAVTGACLMCRRHVFDQVGGFEEQLGVAFNDIDLCLKTLDSGYNNIYVPTAKLYHHESKSRGHEDTPEKIKRFEKEILLIVEFKIDGVPC
jgi:GT2 family glycosyltransferase